MMTFSTSAQTKEAPAKAAGKGGGKKAQLQAVAAKKKGGPTPKSKPASAAAAAAAAADEEDGGEFKQLSRRAKINRFGRSLKPRAKRMASDGGKGNKAPPEVVDECSDPKKYKS